MTQINHHRGTEGTERNGNAISVAVPLRALRASVLIILFMLSTGDARAQERPPYLDPSLPTTERGWT